MSWHVVPSLQSFKTKFCTHFSSLSCPLNPSSSLSKVRFWLKVKYKAVPQHLYRSGRERSYSSYSFMTSAIEWGEWSASRPGRALALGKGPPVPIAQEPGWAPEPVWTHRLEEQSSCLCRRSNLDRPVVQSVARRYTDWATRLPRFWVVP
jgi:hypothetical protein